MNVILPKNKSNYKNILVFTKPIKYANSRIDRIPHTYVVLYSICLGWRSTDLTNRISSHFNTL